jgi:selenide,water dikinase
MLFFGRKKRLSDYASCAGGAGQLPPQAMAQLMRHLPPVNDPNILVGTQAHDDAGVYRLSDDLALVQTIALLGPVVDDALLYGRIAAANALSAVYALGGTSRTALHLAGYPDDKDPELHWLGDMLRGGAECCQAAGAAVLGGHTVRDAEIKFGYAVTGLIHPQKILTSSGARPGDRLVLTKALGTGFVLAAHKADACPQELFDSAVAGMTQLNDIGRDAMLEVGAHAATSIAGLGLAGHALHMAEASKATLVLELSRLPCFPGAEKLAHKPYLTRAGAANAGYVAAALRKEGKLEAVRLEFFYDTQTSGGLLLSVPAAEADVLVAKCRGRGATAAALVGEVVERADAALIVRP